MKMSLRLLLLASVVAATSHLSAAERWSTDETAIRMGIRSWFALQARPVLTGSDAELKALYVSLPAREGPRPTPSGQPENVAVRVEGDRATTTFQLAQSTRQVVLKWERRSGLWKIVEQTVAPTAERVALSDASGK